LFLKEILNISQSSGFAVCDGKGNYTKSVSSEEALIGFSPHPPKKLIAYSFVVSCSRDNTAHGYSRSGNVGGSVFRCVLSLNDTSRSKSV